jgi:spectinomycin phosphotransferase
MAPIPTASGELWARDHDYDWLLYPFFEGRTGFQVELSRAQWVALGRCMRAVHTTTLPAELAHLVPREEYSPRWRVLVREFHRQMTRPLFDDPVTTYLAAWWSAHGDEIRLILDRAEELARVLAPRALPRVLCHSDLHGNNVLVGADDTLAVIDWDEPILAPKERDLMFVGGGVAGVWNRDEEAAWFYEGYSQGQSPDHNPGYGPTAVDPQALAYYRYERIVEDLAAYGLCIIGRQGSVEDREDGLRRLASIFSPGDVVEMAHRAYAA